MPRGELVPLLPSQQPRPDRIDLRTLITTLRRRFKLIVIVLACALLAGALITARQTPSYSATSQVVVNARQQQVAPTAQASAAPTTTDAVATEVIVLQSRSLADKVATALKLDQDPAFVGPPGAKGGIVSRIKRLIGLAPKTIAPVSPAALHQQVIDRLQSGLNVARLDETFALQITYNAPTGPLAARIANAFALQYTNGQLSDKLADTQSTTTLLASRLEGLRQQAQEDANRVEQYRIAHNLLSTTGASLTEQEITSYNEQVASARAQAAEDQARLDTAKAQLRSGSNGGDVGAALDSSVVSTLRARRAEVGGQLASLEARYGRVTPMSSRRAAPCRMSMRRSRPRSVG
jgi:succinoglycan biosynthesis transport protein ExoP